MTLDAFKDKLFDLINDSNLPITDIVANDQEHTLRITTTDQNHFLVTVNEIKYRKLVRFKP